MRNTLNCSYALHGVAWHRTNADTPRWWSHVLAMPGNDLEGLDAGRPSPQNAAHCVVTQFERADLERARLEIISLFHYVRSDRGLTAQ
jgi:hypothetical protein